MNGLQHAQDIQKEKKRTSQPTEEEDEFEEFNDHNWNERMEDPEDGRIWETSWDSEDVSDRFSAELKHRLAVQNWSWHVPGEGAYDYVLIEFCESHMYVF